ncbi:MAG: AraC family transcriptional regulator [Lachnospiraceae bacterium]|nr:AraC family transcriptional regulator [Lachnospiraceae bacterium]
MESYSRIHFVDYSKYNDVQVFEVGRQKCTPRHSYGPIVRGKFILHYVVDGQGKLLLGGKEYSIHGGETFVIYPQELAFYEADANNPWRYLWVIFEGPKAEEILRLAGITEEQPMFYPNDRGTEVLSCMERLLYGYGQELKTIANMYELLQVIQNNSAKTEQNKTRPQQDYIEQMKRYIEYRYAEDVKISELAQHCGLNRSYMTKCFTESVGISPKEYLVQYRIRKAKELLAKEELSVSNVAYTVGYSDPLAFSKMFRKKEGVSPLEFREKLCERNKED